MGRSGISAARLLLRKGAKVTLSEREDTPRIKEKADDLRREGIKVEIGGHREDTFREVELVVVSPGVDPSQNFFQKVKDKGIPIIGELELAHRFCSSPIIAVTGTNGKSTTTALIGEIIKESGREIFIGGNLGTPLSEIILEGKEVDAVVVEVSSFQLETISSFRPFIAVFLNFSEDHLDRYLTPEDYFQAKTRIFDYQKEGDFAILNANCLPLLSFSSRIKARKLFFSTRESLPYGAFVNGKMILARRGKSIEPICPLSKIKLRGEHNLENVLAAVCTSLILNIPPPVIERVISQFQGLEHRMEMVEEIEGVTFINDSKGTNVGAVKSAVESLPHSILLIMGGKDKGGNYSLLREIIEEKVKTLLLIGEGRKRIHQSLRGTTPIVECQSLEEAVRRAFSLAHPGDCVLLSPACSSFDMFQNFEERGEVFKQTVVDLKKEKISSRVNL